MFIGRERELKTLNKRYDSDKFEFSVIYGRRRVGKTALINEFIKNKEAVYFTGVESNAQQNLENLSLAITSFTSEMEGSVFPSFQTALEYIFKLAETKRLVLVIDEYPYAAKASRSLASTLQLLIDKNKDTSKLFLILCGSSMSFMENYVLAYKAPLYGRRTAQFKIQPFEFFEIGKYFNDFSQEELAFVYGMVGGTPQYLLQMNDQLSLEDNIKETFLDPASSLFEEPSNLLKQEVREQAIYNAVISAIAGGAVRLSEIASKVGEETSTCSIYIKNLVSLGIVKKETPFGEKVSRKTIYVIADNLFRFWYRFIPANLSTINRAMPDLAYKKMEPHFSDYMGSVFEEISKQYLWKLLSEGKAAVEFNDLGRWWGNDSREKKQVEIDIMGTDGNNAALFGECKWTNEKVDLNILETLLYRGSLFSYEKKHFYLFAKKGFTTGCIEKAKELENVHLITFEEMK